MTTGTTAESPTLPPAATLIPIRQAHRLTDAGLAYPSTYGQLRWLYRNRKARGLERAFVCVGKIVLFDVAEYRRALGNRQAQSEQSPRD